MTQAYGIRKVGPKRYREDPGRYFEVMTRWLSRRSKDKSKRSFTRNHSSSDTANMSSFHCLSLRRSLVEEECRSSFLFSSSRLAPSLMMKVCGAGKKGGDLGFREVGTRNVVCEAVDGVVEDGWEVGVL